MATEESAKPDGAIPATPVTGPPKKTAIKGSGFVAAAAIILAIVWVIAIDRYADSGAETIRAESPSAALSTGENSSRSATPTDTVGPWENAEIGAQREETLTLIQELRERKAVLDGLAPEMWAKDALGQIASLTSQADEAYKTADYANAREIFRQALAETNAQIERASVVADEAKKAGHHALSDGDLPEALKAFGLAAAIDPSDQAAAAGLTSSSVRDAVDAAMVRGEFALKTDDFSAAREQFNLAAQLDPTDGRPSEALTRASRVEKTSRIDRTTKQGYDALEAGKFEQAISRFSAALVLSPGSGDAKQGLKLAERRLLSQRLDRLKAKGSAAEKNEDWQGAISSYQAALKLGPSKSFALSGLERAKQFLAYEQTVDGYVREPFRLTSNRVAQAAGELVREMSGIAGLPPKLSAKRAKLERLLGDMSAVVDVTIKSDGQSDVAVQRFERLGKFKLRTVGLRYGKYVLTARRIGYVDKRLELEIPVGSQPLSVTLYCDERI